MPRRWTEFLTPAALLAVGCGMLHWTWLSWPDVLVDFGREVYVPWQLARGKTLYSEIAYFNGPFSPYLNAAFFRAFGPGLMTLFAANLLLLTGLTGLLWRLIHGVADRMAATLACTLFLLLFAFSQYVGIGNYNFVAPYSHEVTHGLMLALLSIACLGAFARTRRRAWIVAMGACLGLAFLTKVEMFLAGLVASGGTLALMLRAERAARRVTLRLAAALALGVLVPPVAAFACLASVMPAESALQGVLGSFSALSGAELASLDFYRRGMGLDDPLGNGLRMLAWFTAELLLLAPAAVLALKRRLPPDRVRLASTLAFGLSGGMAWVGMKLTHWPDGARALPLAVGGLVLVSVLRLLRNGTKTVPTRTAIRTALLLLSLVLLGKMLLNARLAQYGFALAMPAVLLVVVALVSWLPNWIDRRGGCGSVFRAAALGAVLAVVLGQLGLMDRQLDRKSYAVGSGRDRMLSDRVRGPAVARALEEIEARLGPEQTLLVLPEGVSLNFLSRRENPTPYINFMPPEFAIFGEQRMLRSLRAHPPDAIAIVHKDTSEYGARFFGRDYGREIYAWVQRRYRPVLRIGKPPLISETSFGILILAPTDSPDPGSPR